MLGVCKNPFIGLNGFISLIAYSRLGTAESRPLKDVGSDAQFDQANSA